MMYVTPTPEEELGPLRRCLIFPIDYHTPELSYALDNLIDYLGITDAYAMCLGLYADPLSEEIEVSLMCEELEGVYHKLYIHADCHLTASIPDELKNKEHYQLVDVYKHNHSMVELRFMKVPRRIDHG